VIVGLIVILVFSSSLSQFAIGPITPLLVADYGVGNGTVGLLTSIPLFSHVIIVIPVSLLIRRLELKTLILLGGMAGSAPLLTFMSTDNFLLLLTLRAIHGFSFMFLFPAIGPLFMQWFPSRQLPLANGVLMVSVGLGIATSAFIVAPLSEIFRWDLALSVFGGLSLLSSVAWWLFGKSQTTYPDEREVQTNDTDDMARPLIMRVWDVVRDRTTLLVSIADAGPFAFLAACLTWLPTFYYEVHDISLTAAGVYTGVLQSFGVIGLVLASLLTARTSKRKPFIIGPGILVIFAGVAALMLAESFSLYIAVAVLGFACWFYLPALMTIPMNLYPNDPHRVSLIVATGITISSLASSTTPWIIGIIADMTGSLMPGLLASTILGGSLVIAGILLPSTDTSRAKLNPRSNLP
jgi:CP family cyanate transporter-like MFS transporter